MATFRELALQKGLKEVGVKEVPADSNSGPRVMEYQSATSLGGTGWPWCAAFVNWCYREVGRPLVELTRSASVPVLLSTARKIGWAVHVPARGDVVCYDWDTLTGPDKGETPDHVGIIVKITSATTFQALEGNTAVGNDSNGGQVMLRDRNVSMVEGFFRVPGAKDLHDFVATVDGEPWLRRETANRLALALAHKRARVAKKLRNGHRIVLKRIAGE